MNNRKRKKNNKYLIERNKLIDIYINLSNEVLLGENELIQDSDLACSERCSEQGKQLGNLTMQEYSTNIYIDKFKCKNKNLKKLINKNKKLLNLYNKYFGEFGLKINNKKIYGKDGIKQQLIKE